MRANGFPRVSLVLPTVLAIIVAACGGGGEGDRVSVQLDWTPNTNHTGIYIALANGWYKEAGLDVEVLPYGDVNPDVIVANGNADVGISFPPNVIFSRAAGLDLVSIAAVLQHNVTELAVLKSSDIQRPRDFVGRTYAGFGLPYEGPQVRAVIEADGGSGDFDSVTLTTAAYEALYNGRADFTEIYTTWEGIEAQLRGVELRTFRYDKFGVPDFPGVLLVASENTIEKRGPVLRRFLEVTRRGYEFAAAQPEESARILLDYLPPETFPEPEMVRRSSKLIARSLLAADGRWGVNDPTAWQQYTAWMLAQGVVTDSRGEVLTDGIDGADLFTNDLIEP